MNRGSIPSRSDFSLFRNVRTGSEIRNLRILLEKCHLSPEINRSGREDYQTPASNAKVKNYWSYTSTTSYTFMVWTGATLTSGIDTTKDESGNTLVTNDRVLTKIHKLSDFAVITTRQFM
jgi:hypothetical protein